MPGDACVPADLMHVSRSLLNSTSLPVCKVIIFLPIKFGYFIQQHYQLSSYLTQQVKVLRASLLLPWFQQRAREREASNTRKKGTNVGRKPVDQITRLFFSSNIINTRRSGLADGRWPLISCFFANFSQEADCTLPPTIVSFSWKGREKAKKEHVCVCRKVL